MSSFSVHVLERGEVSANEVEAAFENQVLHGGHLGTNLVELGVLDEAGFQELLSSFYDLPLGPAGRLPEVTESLAALVKAGKTKRIGFSEIAPSSLRRAAKVHPIAAVQSEYSLWSRQPPI